MNIDLKKLIEIIEKRQKKYEQDKFVRTSNLSETMRNDILFNMLGEMKGVCEDLINGKKDANATDTSDFPVLDDVTEAYQRAMPVQESKPNVISEVPIEDYIAYSEKLNKIPGSSCVSTNRVMETLCTQTPCGRRGCDKWMSSESPDSKCPSALIRGEYVIDALKREIAELKDATTIPDEPTLSDVRAAPPRSPAVGAGLARKDCACRKVRRANGTQQGNQGDQIMTHNPDTSLLDEIAGYTDACKEQPKGDDDETKR